MDIKKLIGYRINNALASNNLRQKDLAKYLDVTDNTISYFCSGKRTPNVEQIIKIAQFLNVSTDYSLGLSEACANNEEIQSICDYLGVSEKTVKCIKEISNRLFDDEVPTLTPYKIILNSILESPSFSSIIDDCLTLVMTSDNIGEFKPIISEHKEQFLEFADITRYKLIRSFDELIDLFDSRKNNDIAETIGKIFNNEEVPDNGEHPSPKK